MSRDRVAPLVGALVCLIALFGSSRGVFAWAPPTQDQFDEVLARLEQAEAEIEELRSFPGRPASYLDDAPGLEGIAVPPVANDAPPGGWQAHADDLERRFNDFKANLTKKKPPYIELHAVAQVDTGWYGQDQTNINEFGVLRDGMDFRRARLAAVGALTSNVNYFFQMDFAFPGRPTFTDVWVEMTKIPFLGNVRVGQWKQPFSLEVVSSFRYTMMPERSLLFNAFTPFRHPGLGFYNWSDDERMTWAASVYRSGQDQFGDSIASSGGYAGVGRITGLPWWEDNGRRYLHLGAGYNYVAPVQRFGAFRTIPEFFIGQTDVLSVAGNGTAGSATPTANNGTPFFVNTGNFFMNHYNLVGTELLWVEGPLTVQSEFMYLSALRNNGLLANFSGFYTQAGYFLTGEHRPYNRQAGALDRIKVLNDVGNNEETGCYGWGAWEIANRISYIDLNSRDIQGGRLWDYTVCLNWYINSFTKVQLEYIRADLTNPKFGNSITSLYDIRVQYDF